MSKPDTYFVILKASAIDNKRVRLQGQLIVNAQTQIPGEASSQPDEEPQLSIQLAKHFQPKWVLPPRTSEFYGSVKHYAEAAGYDTVENDDLRYPPG